MEAAAPAAATLPELADVYWRPRVDAAALRRRERLWSCVTAAQVVPFVLIAGVIVLIAPPAFPVSLIALAKAWLIPALYAQRGANVVRPARSSAPPPERSAPQRQPQRRALGLLADLVDHDARALLVRTGLVVERGRFGIWVLGEAGAVLVRPGGRRVLCYCVRVPDPELPGGDRIAHLLLALRADEAGLATIANTAFAGARRRLRRRLSARARPALDAAARAATI